MSSLGFSYLLLEPDAPPRGLNITPTSSGLRIAWDTPAVLSGPTSYIVQVTSLSFKFHNLTQKHMNMLLEVVNM